MTTRINVNDIENALRQDEFTRRVVAAANGHMRINEPTWDLYDVRVSTATDVLLNERKVAVTLFFKDNGLGVL